MLTGEELKRLCRLARLDLREDEVPRLLADLGRILGYVEALREIDTSGVHEAALERAEERSLRGDEERVALTPPAALANAPEVQDGHFAVPAAVARGDAFEELK